MIQLMLSLAEMWSLVLDYPFIFGGLALMEIGIIGMLWSGR